MAIFGYLGADSLRPHMYKYQWISRYSSVVKFNNTVHLYVLRVGAPFSVTLGMIASIQLDDLSRLTREEQWPLWLEDFEDILILKDLKRHYDGTAVEPSGPEFEEQQLEFIQKHEAIRSIIHSAISPEIHKHMKDHGYDEAKHRV